MIPALPARLTTILGFVSIMSGAAYAAPEKAQCADRFVESIGVNVHWNYPDTPYGSRYPEVKRLLVDSGIRHVRGDLSRARDLSRSHIATMVSVGPGPNQNADISMVRKIREQIKQANVGGVKAIDWVEGPNEPDLFWQKTPEGDAHGLGAIGYKGQGYAQGEKGIIQGVIAFQKDLYTTFKEDAATSGIKIIGPALGKTYGYDNKSPYGAGTLTGFVDYGNFHPYPGGNPFSDRAGYDTLDWYIGHGTQPSANMDEFKFAFDVYAPPFAPKPMACSESGYSDFINGQTESVQAKYIPRLFCEYFLHGIVRTYLYEFVDVFDNKADRDSNFGLIRNDLTPKPSYSAVKNLIDLLADPGEGLFRPGALDYTLTVNPVTHYQEPRSKQILDYDRTRYVHHLLLQKRSGDFYLVLWHEVSDEDGGVSPHRLITPPAMPTTITLPTSIRAVSVFRPNKDTVGRPLSVHNGAIRLDVPDELMILKLSPPAH